MEKLLEDYITYCQTEGVEPNLEELENINIHSIYETENLLLLRTAP